MRLGVMLAMVAAAAPARAELGYYGLRLDGPHRRACADCTVRETMAAPGRPYRSVQIIAAPRREPRWGDDRVPVYLAVRVKRGWYVRIVAWEGTGVTPHFQPQPELRAQVELGTLDVISGGGDEIVVTVTTEHEIGGAWKPMRVDAWVLSTDARGVPFTVATQGRWAAGALARARIEMRR